MQIVFFFHVHFLWDFWDACRWDAFGTCMCQACVIVLLLYTNLQQPVLQFGSYLNWCKHTFESVVTFLWHFRIFFSFSHDAVVWLLLSYSQLLRRYGLCSVNWEYRIIGQVHLCALLVSENIFQTLLLVVIRSVCMIICHRWSFPCKSDLFMMSAIKVCLPSCL